MINILLTSAGRRSYLAAYFRNALGGRGLVHTANSSPQNPAFKMADRYIVTPLIYSDDYIPFLLNYCKCNNISMIIPLFDVDLPVLASKRELFATYGVIVLVSDSWVIDICNDKWKTVDFLKKNGIGHPKTFLNLNDAVLALKTGELEFPVIVKPRRGMGSIGIFEAETFDELNIFYKKATNMAMTSYIHYEAMQDVNHTLIQQKIDGIEYHLDVINDLNGNYQNTIVKRKLSMRAGETDCAQIIEHTKLWNIGKYLSELLRHRGNLDVDVFQDGDIYYVLEMNARFGGGYPFSHVAGVDLPQAIIQWQCGIPVDKDALLCATLGITAHKDIQIVVIDV